MNLLRKRSASWFAASVAVAALGLGLASPAFADDGATIGLGTFSGGQLVLTATNTSTAGEVLFNVDGGLAPMSGFQFSGAAASPGAGSFCGVVGTGHDQFACNWNPELSSGSSGQVTLSLNPSAGYTGGIGGMVCFDPNTQCLPFSVAQGQTMQVGAGGSGPPAGGGGNAAHCDWTVAFVSSEATAMAGSELTYKIEVRNGGTATCPDDTLTVRTNQDTAAGREAYLADAKSGHVGTPAGLGEEVPSLAPAESTVFTVVSWSGTIDGPSLFGSAPTGLLTLTATMPADDDAGSDEAASSTTDLEFLGASRANSPCAAPHPAAALAATTCALPAAKLHSFNGTASGHVRRVQIALGRLGRGLRFAGAGGRCSWLRNARAQFTRKPATGRRCGQATWLNAKGTRHWQFALRRKLPAGRYVLYTRPVTTGDAPEAGFSASRHDKQAFTLR
jgi:hypothetical protein